MRVYRLRGSTGHRSSVLSPELFLEWCKAWASAAILVLLGVGGFGPPPTFTALWVIVAVAGAILMNTRKFSCT